jgi:hypothetical protein
MRLLITLSKTYGFHFVYLNLIHTKQIKDNYNQLSSLLHPENFHSNMKYFSVFIIIIIIIGISIIINF